MCHVLLTTRKPLQTLLAVLCLMIKMIQRNVRLGDFPSP